MSKITVLADKSRLDEVLSFVDAFLEENDCSPKEQMRIDVAVEEIFVNIASYAYEGADGTADITCEMDNGTGQAVITFEDSGRQFDPLAKPDPDVSLSAEARGIGGLGIYMVKKSMDDVAYRYENGRNILTLTKTIR